MGWDHRLPRGAATLSCPSPGSGTSTREITTQSHHKGRGRQGASWRCCHRHPGSPATLQKWKREKEIGKGNKTKREPAQTNPKNASGGTGKAEHQPKPPQAGAAAAHGAPRSPARPPAHLAADGSGDEQLQRLPLQLVEDHGGCKAQTGRWCGHRHPTRDSGAHGTPRPFYPFPGSLVGPGRTRPCSAFPPAPAPDAEAIKMPSNSGFKLFGY